MTKKFRAPTTLLSHCPALEVIYIIWQQDFDTPKTNCHEMSYLCISIFYILHFFLTRTVMNVISRENERTIASSRGLLVLHGSSTQSSPAGGAIYHD